MNKKDFGEIIVGILFFIFGIITTYYVIKISFTEPIKDNIINIFGLFLTLPWILIGFLLITYEAKQKSKKNKRNITISTKYKDIKTTIDDDGIDYQIITSWVNPEDKKLYLFSSDLISSDVAKMLEEEKITIKEFLVTYEQNNIRNYEMDITKLNEVKHEKN